VLSPTWSRSCKHFVAKLGTAGIFLERYKETENEKDNERYDRPKTRERESEKDNIYKYRAREIVRKIDR
jgi:hypothetical protein